jgi:WD40 repeat protein
MRLIFTGLVIFVLISFSPVLGKTDSCLESFRDFDPVEAKVNPTNRNEDYDSVISMAWYGECILAGSTNGLWLYDIHQPDTPITLAHINERAITNVAVNPRDNAIAFSVAQEPMIYFINPDETVSTRKSQGDVVTYISYSSDGSLIAVASAKIMGRDTELWGLYYDSAIQILNNLQVVIASIPSSSDRTYVIVTKSIFSVDNQHLLTHDVREGYFGDEATYWDIQTGKKVWDYNDLFMNRKSIPDTDPLYLSMLSMNGHIAGLGGLDGVMDWDDYYGTAVHLWDVNTQQRLGYVVISRRGGSHDNPLTDLAFNHEGSILVTGQSDGSVRFWNTKNVSEMTGSIQLRSSISQISYDMGDRYLAIRDGNEVVVWDTEMNVEVSAFDVVKSN